jgi:glycosyltransferase involved in cell wall biosynthesis
MKDLSLVIPVFNEEKIVVNAIETIIAETSKIEDLESFELIIVDDGSNDRTWELLTEQLCPAHGEIHAIKLSRNFGKESALCAGLEIADSRAVVVLDADLQHPPALIGEMYRIWLTQSVDIVEAVKRSRGQEPFLSRMAANGFYSLFSNLSGVNLKNASDFKLMDKRVVDAWKELPERNIFFRGMSAWVGFSRQQIEFDVAERADSVSKWSTLSLFRLALTSIAAYSSAPLHLITVGGLVFIVFSIFLGISTLYQYSTGVAVSGFSTVILLLLIIGGAIMVSLGIIGEYLARIYDEVKARPRYLISDDSREPKTRQHKK